MGLYDFYKDAVIWLPMDAQRHDPTNNRALDISGNDNHATFGDGSTSSTFPTKLPTKGYSFDGGDYMKSIAGQIVDTGYLTMTCLFRSISGGTDSVFYYGESSTDVGGLIQYDDTNDKVYFYCGGDTVVNRAEISVPNPRFQLLSCIGVYDGTNTSIYVNSIKGTDATTPLAPGLDSGMSAYLGVLGNLSQHFSGDIYFASIHDYALTPLQVKDLHYYLLEGINDV